MCLKKTMLAFATFAVVIMGLGSMTANAETIIYSDSFSGSSGADLNGLSPTVTTGSATWNASTWKADGSLSASTGQHNAYLSFTPVSGKVYTLSVGVAGLSGTGGFEFGFSSISSTTPGYFFDENASAWFYDLAGQSKVTASSDKWNNQTDYNFTSTGTDQLKVVLNTAEAAWTAEWFVNGTSIKTYTYTTNPTINYVGFGTYASTAQVSNLQLSAASVPEPSTFALLVGALFGLIAYAWRKRKQ